jgi:ubiquinone/menaquinone biosynthesis C-methylase UbiE
VLATDLQPEMLELLAQKARREGARNIELLNATETETRLPADRLDLCLMVDVYHELSHPLQVLQQVRRALKEKGRLVLVEYRGEDPAVPIEPAGFLLDKVWEFLPQQRVLVFVKATSQVKNPLPAEPQDSCCPSARIGAASPHDRATG